MVNWRVKHKVRFSTILVALAAVTFGLSWARLFPAKWVAKLFAGGVCVTISHITGCIAELFPFSWLYVDIAIVIALLVYTYRLQNLRILLGAAAAAYLWAFWSWGLNYHRPPLTERMHLSVENIGRTEVDQFVQTAAS